MLHPDLPYSQCSKPLTQYAASCLTLPCYAPTTTPLLLLTVPQVSLAEVTGPVPMAGMPDMLIRSGLFHAATHIRISYILLIACMPCLALPCSALC